MENSPIIMPFGKYKGQEITRLPAYYLAMLHQSNPEMMGKHPKVKAFIEAQYASLLPINTTIDITAPALCDTFKIAYVDKEAADRELKIIRRDPRKHKKPVRSYQCERCGLWHHTSQPL